MKARTIKQAQDFYKLYPAQEIEEYIGNKLSNKTPWGWSYLPNCAAFKITLSKYQANFAKFGMRVRIPPSIEITPYENKDANRYLEYQCRRLESLRKHPDKFWKVAIWLVKNSMVFRVSAFQRILPNWHRKYPFWTIFNINKRVHELLRKEDDNAKFYRVYIPKGDTHRPLGVPTKEWRIISHMMNNMLTIFLKPHLLESQHGFIPGRGTLTAWREIFQKVLQAPFIYECDLKQFFPSVHVNRITECLFDLGLPKKMGYWLENINRCNPILPVERKLDESRYEMSEQDKQDIRNGYFRWESKLYDPVRDFVMSNGGFPKGLDLLYEVSGSNNIFELVQEQWALFDMYKPHKVPNQFEGVPQGLPTSPLLSIITLKNFLTQVRSVSYADDPIFYDDKDFSITDEPDNGIVINKDKSGWVKRNGEWLKPLKFLGLTYHPPGPSLEGNGWVSHEPARLIAATRKGATTELHNKDVQDFIDVFDLDKDFPHDNRIKHPYKSWYNLLSSRIAGVIQSRLYAGSWTSTDISQDFRFKFSNYSWVSKAVKDPYYEPGLLDTFNSSSYACHSLLDIFEGYRRKAQNKVIRRVVSFKFRAVKPVYSPLKPRRK